MRRRRRGLRLSTAGWYAVIIGVVLIGVLAFLIFGGGGDAPVEPSKSPEPVATPIPTPINEDVVLVPYKANDLWGYKSNTGEIKIEAQYAEARPFADGIAFVATSRDGVKSYGIISADGAWIVEPLYTDVSSFSEGYAAVCYNGEWGYITPQGAFITDSEFSFAGNFSGGLARVTKNGKFGYINASGDFVINNQYDAAVDFSEGMAFVAKTAEGTSQLSWYLITDSEENVAAVSIAEGGVYSEGLAAVKLTSGKFTYFNRRGKQAFDATFNSALQFSEGLAAVETNGLWGYIDTTGEYVIAAQFADAKPFSEELAAVKDASGNWGYIDASGTYVIQGAYSAAESFSEGYALVQKPLEQGIIDANNNYKALYVIDAAPVESPDAERTGKVIADKLNVREEPDKESDRVTRIDEGETVKITGESGDWYKIEYDDKEGYVMKEFIETE